MVGPSGKDDSDSNSTWASEELSIRDGKVNKKRGGLSRFYPSKAQSFDCIAELLCPLGDNDAVAESALLLSKSMCPRGPSSRTLQRIASQYSSGSGRLRRVNTMTSMADDSSAHDPEPRAGLEADLCSAFDATSIHPHPPRITCPMEASGREALT
jgi:hypothetical protein